ncbi:SpoIIE family protein phosphatase [Shimia sp. CNT1-13L.2]|uniref:PP2C family protein-serine/threonine phosphatase n=1 Tax=Shimia sp. CNT1-13L.2 TaxID=2959663 RepID=UPI0020CF8047|nr:SpoIIE family protein phosphatase [Shimia sp. CNT1-13L.2]MCP9482595.1 SpoIIE family protein phosphatase [Shimia sp. CNT1-13L.2]
MSLQKHQDVPTKSPPRAIKRVLLVDDSQLQRRILSASLVRDGYEVHEAASGEEALQHCLHQRPDLIISDWVMPGMDGLEFCQAFRALPSDGYGYFILLTSKSEKAEVAKGLESGADDFISKPVNAHELRARINAGDRILRMQKELTQKNEVISQTLGELRRLYGLLDNDLLEAKELQQSLVKETFQVFDSGSVSYMLQPSGHVGGDLVGHYRISPHQIGLYALDVSGHGVSSALMTARLAGYLSSNSADQNIALVSNENGETKYLAPSQVAARLNNILLSELETEHYFTMLLAVLDLKLGRVSMTQAGHPHPVILRKTGKVEFLGSGGFPIGLIKDVEYQELEVDLNEGDRLLILSDGVTECSGPDGHLLGESALSKLLYQLRNQPVETMLADLHKRLIAFSGSEKMSDDVSGILFEFSPCARHCKHVAAKC